MKIAISTNDGLMMAPSFENSEKFLVLNVVLGEIIKEEIRWKREPDKWTVEDIAAFLSDCSQVVVRRISESSSLLLSDKGIRVIRTNEEIITNIIVHYLEHEYREASDHCCCP
jgi:predicted Fe-Mo cluster-binding NifX family protein